MALSISHSNKPGALQSAGSNLWEKAASRLKDSKDWIAFRNTIEGSAQKPASDIETAEKIGALARDAREKTKKGLMNVRVRGTTIVFRVIFEKIINWMGAIAPLGFAATAVNPFASLAWGALQFFVQAAINYQQIREALWEGLEKIGYLLSRYKIFETLYPQKNWGESGSSLEDALVALYTSIFKYEITVVRYSTTLTDRLKTILKKPAQSESEAILNDIREQDREVIRIQGNVDRDIHDRYHEELLDSLYNLDQPLKGLQSKILDVSSIIQTIERVNILSWVSPIKYENPHKEKVAVSGTGTWLLNHQEYVAWRSSSASTILLLNGFMGSGKSCLAHVIIEDIRKSEKVTYFYCDGTTSDSGSQLAGAATIIRCLLKQMADYDQNEKLLKEVKDVYNKQSTSADLSRDEAYELLLITVDLYSKTTIVIDGLDECPSGTRGDVIDCLIDIVKNSKSLVKLFISSRPIPELEHRFGSSTSRIDTNKNNEADIENLIISIVDTAAKSPSLKLSYDNGKQSQRDAIVNILKNGSQGMFRWVELSVAYLHRQPVHYRALTNRLTQLSRLESLFALYDLIYKQIDELDHEDKEAVKAAFHFILHGRSRPTPLGTEGPGGLRDMQPKYDAAYLIEGVNFAATKYLDQYYSADMIANLAPSFLAPDGKTMSFPHFSVKEYLLTKHVNEYGYAKGQAYLAELSMRLFTMLSKQTTADIYSPFAECSAFNWISHLLEFQLNFPGDKTFAWLLEKEQSLKAVLEVFLLESPAPAGFLLSLDYIQFCIHKFEFHFETVLEPARALGTSPPSSLFARLLLNHGWDSEDLSTEGLDVCAADKSALVPRNLNDPASIHFAIWTGNYRAVNWLVGKGLDINVKDRWGRNGLRYAMHFRDDPPILFRILDHRKFNRALLVQRLSESGMSIDVKDRFGGGPLHWRLDAQDNCLEAIFKEIIKHGVNPTAKDNQGYTPMDFALRWKNRKMVELLMTKIPFGTAEFDINFLNVGGRTILDRAAEYFDENAIKMLIEKGADPQLKNGDGRTPLQYALRYRNLPVIKHLIAVTGMEGIDFNSREGPGIFYTLFHMITRFLPEEIVRLCVEKGANPYIRNTKGEMPLDFAEKYQDGSLVQFLRSLPHDNYILQARQIEALWEDEDEADKVDKAWLKLMG